MLGHAIRTVCRRLKMIQFSEDSSQVRHTKEEFVLVHNVAYAEVECSEDQNERLNDTIEYRDDEDEECLRVNCSIVDHWRRIQFCKVSRSPGDEEEQEPWQHHSEVQQLQGHNSQSYRHVSNILLFYSWSTHLEARHNS